MEVQRGLVVTQGREERKNGAKSPCWGKENIPKLEDNSVNLLKNDCYRAKCPMLVIPKAISSRLIRAT